MGHVSLYLFTHIWEVWLCLFFSLVPLSVTLLMLLLLLSRCAVRPCATPQTAAHQAPASLGFSRKEHCSGSPFPSPVHESEKWKWSCSVVSDSSRPHGRQPTRQWAESSLRRSYGVWEEKMRAGLSLSRTCRWGKVKVSNNQVALGRLKVTVLIPQDKEMYVFL